MAQDDIEIKAIAGVYAQGFFEAIVEQGQELEATAQFADLIEYMDRDRDFNAFMTAESVDDDSRRPSLEKIFRGRMNDLLLNFLQTINNRFRCGILREVHRQVELRMMDKMREQEVIVESAFPLTDRLRDAITEDVGKKIGKKALLREKVNPALIGGVVIRIGDLQIDGSVAARLRSTRQRVFERTTEAISQGRGF